MSEEIYNIKDYEYLRKLDEEYKPIPIILKFENRKLSKNKLKDYYEKDSEKTRLYYGEDIWRFVD